MPVTLLSSLLQAMELPNLHRSATTADPSDARQDADIRLDEEKSVLKEKADLAPLPFTIRDRVLETFLHPVAIVTQLLATIALLILGVRSMFLDRRSASQTLVPKALMYNKGLEVQFLHSAKLDFDDKAMSLMFGGALGGLLISFFAVLWGLVSLLVPRQKLLKIPPARFITNEVAFWLLLNGGADAGTYFYASFLERDSAHGSGCYTYANRNGRQIAKCTVESATCYASYWPESPQGIDTTRMCWEARVVRYLTLILAICSASLFAVLEHQKRIQIRNTTTEQRKEAAEKEEKTRNEKKGVIVGRKWENWFYALCGLSLLHTLIQWYRDV